MARKTNLAVAAAPELTPRHPQYRVESHDEADAAVKECALLDIEIETAELQMNEQITRVQEETKSLVAPLQEIRKRLESAVVTYARQVRPTLAGKTLKFNFGAVAFRAGSPSAKLLDGVSMETVVANCKRLGQAGLVKTREYVDLDDLKSLPAALHEQIGFRVVTPEESATLKVESKKLALMERSGDQQRR